MIRLRITDLDPAICRARSPGNHCANCACHCQKAAWCASIPTARMRLVRRRRIMPTQGVSCGPDALLPCPAEYRAELLGNGSCGSCDVVFLLPKIEAHGPRSTSSVAYSSLGVEGNPRRVASSPHGLVPKRLGQRVDGWAQHHAAALVPHAREVLQSCSTCTVEQAYALCDSNVN